MGVSRVVSFGEVPTDKTYEKGFGTTPLINKDTCGATAIMMGHCLHNPGARNQEHVHTRCEVQWFIAEGRSRHYSCTTEHTEYKETECYPGTVGYVAPNEIHVGMNLNPEDTGLCIFCYAGINDHNDTGIVYYEDADVVEKYMASHGKSLEEILK